MDPEGCSGAKVTEDNRRAGWKVKPGGAEGMEGKGAAGSKESCGGTRVTPDQGRDRGTREPSGADRMTGHGGDKGACSQGGTDGLAG